MFTNGTWETCSPSDNLGEAYEQVLAGTTDHLGDVGEAFVTAVVGIGYFISRRGEGVELAEEAHLSGSGLIAEDGVDIAQI